MFVKALFDYYPNEDKAIPCKEAGLSFRKGDILQIMCQDDATWWQAKHEGDANPRAGLIPSKQFQERLAMKFTLLFFSALDCPYTCTILSVAYHCTFTSIRGHDRPKMNLKILFHKYFRLPCLSGQKKKNNDRKR